MYYYCIGYSDWECWHSVTLCHKNRYTKNELMDMVKTCSLELVKTQVEIRKKEYPDPPSGVDISSRRLDMLYGCSFSNIFIDHKGHNNLPDKLCSRFGFQISRPPKPEVTLDFLNGISLTSREDLERLGHYSKDSVELTEYICDELGK